MFNRIVIITDCTDVAANEIRAKIISFIGKDVCIEPVVKVSPLSVINGSFLLRLVVEAYPKDTLFYVVLNPIQLQTNRVVCVLRDGQVVIGRDTGVFSMLSQANLIKKVFLIPYTKFVPFGGKMIYPQWIAKFMKQKKLVFKGLKELPTKTLILLDNNKYKVLHIDNFGLIKTSIPPQFFSESQINEGNKINVFIDGEKKLEATYAERMMSETDGEWIIYKGSSLGGLIEIGQVRKHNTPKKMNICVGDTIELKVKTL